MPSSHRPNPRRDRKKRPEVAAASAAAATGEDSPAGAAALHQPQHSDPDQAWDAWDRQAAEALTHLYESGEALDRQRDPPRPRRWRPPHSAVPASAPALPPPPAGDGAWLEARLAEMAQRLQEVLAGLGAGTSLSPLNRRLDLIEQRFGEALAAVAQRSDVAALHLIEANVLELAQHMEQARGRLDRLDAIDAAMRELARRVEQGDQQRLAGLENLLQSCAAEWRRGEERTAGALTALEEAVNRVGESVEALEAHKPATDLPYHAFVMAEAVGSSLGRDPLAQAYAGAARALELPGSSLDAADYTPPPEPATGKGPPPLPRQASAGAAQPSALPEPAGSGADLLLSPAMRASAVRAKLRQAQLLEGEGETAHPPPRSASAEAAKSASWWRNRAGLLLSIACIALAAGGYRFVDLLMTTAVQRPAGIVQAAQPANANAVAAVSGGSAGGIDAKASEDAKAEPASQASGSKFASPQAIGGAIKAAFRATGPAEQPASEPAALPPQDLPAPSGDGVGPAIAALPMTIGPASLRQAAMRGEAAAQFEIAGRFAAGLGVPRDWQQAARWYGRAAAQGLALAQYRLAMLHERGLGIAADPERARVWYGRAAEQGNVRAMHNLAVLSVSGGRSDYATAAKWFAKAADLGLADSQFNLAVLHQTGLGVTKDLRLAYKWLVLAGRAGDREALARIDEIKARLSPADVQAAEALVAGWRVRTPDPGVNEPAALSMAP